MSAVVDKVHSILSPSGAKRWTKCTASLAACKGVVEDRSGPRARAAALGTAKHQVAEHILNNPDKHITAVETSELAHADGFSFPMDFEFCDHVNTALAHIRSLGGDQSYERWVSTEPLFGIPGQGGTIDVVAVHLYDGILEILDEKYGYTYVAPDAPQLKIYATALLAELDPHRSIFVKVRLHVSQPKLGDNLRTAEFTPAELWEYIDSIKYAAQEAYSMYMGVQIGTLNAHAVELAKKPSDEACEWCDIRLTCAARLKQLSGDFPIMPSQSPDVPVTYDPGLMTAEQLDSALTRIDSVVKFVADWADNLRAEALRRAYLNELPGWGVYEGKKGARAVPAADRPMFEQIVVADLGAAAYEAPELKSPTQLEKVYKKLGKLEDWKTIQDGPAAEDGTRKGGWVVQAPGSPSLMRTTAGAKPIAEMIANEFGLIEVK
jgi:hypothetical protein